MRKSWCDLKLLFLGGVAGMAWLGATDATDGITPQPEVIPAYTNRDTSTAARTKSANNGCGANGFDFSSGWN